MACDTRVMAVPCKRGLLLFAVCIAALPTRADEIRLKDGKKLYGVIVAYEDNMFKVKTDFGFILVEKDKIAAIVPTVSDASSGITDGQPSAKNGKASKPPVAPQSKKDSVIASSSQAAPAPTEASAKEVESASAEKRQKTASVLSNGPVKPELPATSAKSEAIAPSIKAPAATTPGTTLANNAAPPAPPKAPEPPANREEIQGNLYTNYTHGFRMYKAPSWALIDDARTNLPNAIVAMGTSNESTLMVVGEEKTKDALPAAAAAVEKRLHEVYDNYRLLSQRKTVVGGLPAIEFRYRGLADDHDWSGTLVVVARGPEVFTVLGMTYADTDLIQIQENVIARAVSSLSFQTP